MRKDMSIIKIEINMAEAVKVLKQFKKNRMQAFETLNNDIKLAVGDYINGLLNAEMSLFLGQEDQCQNKRNGYKEKHYTLKGIGTLLIRLPQARNKGFNSYIIPSGERIDPRLKEDMAVLSLAGISTRTLSMISKRLLGIQVSKDTVSSSLDLVSDRACSWLRRPLNDEYWALYIDGTQFNLQRKNTTEKEPSLVVLGINKDGYKSILSIEPGYKDQAECWRTVFKELKQRGLDGSKIKIGIMDGLPGLERVFQEEFPRAVTQRCWVHALKNALNKCPKRFREIFKSMADKVMYADSRSSAKAAFSELKSVLEPDAQRAISCIEKDLESLLAYYAFDRSYWRALRTTNPIERINKELKRRTKSMESLGEQTLEIVVAFIALKMEVNWRINPVNAKNVENLKYVKQNAVEEVIGELID